MNQPQLPAASADRKGIPVCTGVLDYFPLAIAEIARVSKAGNDQHNPGEPLHWARDKSTDHADCLIRHTIERGQVDSDGQRHSAKLAWRALALLQTELEETAPPAVQSSEEAIAAQIRARKPGERFVYIAGPMRGLPSCNFPAFDAARDWAKKLGWTPISPADIDRAHGVSDHTFVPFGGGTTAEKRTFAQRDVSVLLAFDADKGDAIALMPDWEKSTAAPAEFFVSRWVGLALLDARTFQPFEPEALNRIDFWATIFNVRESLKSAA